MFDPALALEGEGQGRSIDLEVPLVEGGQAIGAILPGVFGVADPDQADLQQAHGRGQNLLATGPAPVQVHFDPPPQLR
jgi:hypothetical protein